MDESMTLQQGTFKTEFKLYWSDTYASLMFHHEENGAVREQFLMDASSVILFDLAEQLSNWAFTLQQIEHDNMDKAMAQIKGRVTVSPDAKGRLMIQHGLTEADFIMDVEHPDD